MNDPKKDWFAMGMKFRSYKKLTQYIKEYQENNSIMLETKSAVYLDSLSTIPKQCSTNESVLKSLHIYSITYSCEYGNRAYRTTSINRNTSTKKFGCPFKVLIGISHSHLEIRECCGHSNHPFISIRKLNNVDIDDENLHRDYQLTSSVSTIANAQSIKTNTYVDPKNLHNRLEDVKQKEIEKNKAILNKFEEDFTFHRILNKSGKEIAYLYQDPYMQRLWNTYSDVVIMDSTFDLYIKKWSFFALVVINGDGISEIAGWFVVQDESYQTVSKVFDILRELNNYEHVESFLIDKDFTEIKIIKDYFINSEIQFCRYHVIKAFGRKVSSKNLNLTKEEVENDKSVFKQIIDCQTTEEMDILSLNFTSQTKIYFENNWKNIPHKWVDNLKKKNINLGLRTTGRIENLFKRLKDYLNLHNPLEKLTTDLFNFINTERNKMNNKLTKKYMKISRKLASLEILECKRYLTRFAYKFLILLIEESNKIVRVNMQIDEDCESCIDNKRVDLPCIHMLSYRRGPSYIINNSASRWSRSVFYSFIPHDFFFFLPETNERINTVPIENNHLEALTDTLDNRNSNQSVENCDIVDEQNDFQNIDHFDDSNDIFESDKCFENNDNEYESHYGVAVDEGLNTDEGYLEWENTSEYLQRSWPSMFELTKTLTSQIDAHGELKLGKGEQLIRKIIELIDDDKMDDLFKIIKL